MGEADRVAGASEARSGDAAAGPTAAAPEPDTVADAPKADTAAAAPQGNTADEPSSAGPAPAEARDPVGRSAVDDATMAMDPEQLRDALAAVISERDAYLDTAQRVQAEFDNFRKRSVGDVEERVKGGLGRMVEALLPVLDACDAAVAQGDSSAEAMRSQLLAVLTPRGLEPIEAAGEPFDPNLHDAVLHEQGDGGEAVVAEELRPGYRWNGKVLRATMVKVRN